MQSFNDAYGELLWNTVKGKDDIATAHSKPYEGVSVEDSVTQMARVRSWPFPIVITVDTGDEILPIQNAIPTSLMLAAKETVWAMLGTNEPGEYMGSSTALFEKFKNGDRFSDAYGLRWRHRNKFDQLDAVVELLIQDPSSRKAMVTTWDPMWDLLGSANADPMRRYYAPCPTHFMLRIARVKGSWRLNSTLFLRSSDLIRGLPLDVMRHTMVVEAIRHEFNDRSKMVYANRPHPPDWPVFLEAGCASFILHNAHVYGAHLTDRFVECLDSHKERLKQWTHNSPSRILSGRIPTMSFTEIREDPEPYLYEWSEIQGLLRSRTQYSMEGLDLEVVV